MRDVELYQQLLGLVASWTVGRVELSVEGERVDSWAAHAPEVRWPWPGVRDPVTGLRSFGGAGVEAFGQLPIQDLPARPCASYRVPHRRDAAGEAAVGRSAFALHAAL